MYFTPRRYDLAKVGRYKLNRKLGVDVPMDSPEASVLSQDDIAQMIRYLCALHAGETSIPRCPRRRGNLPQDRYRRH